MLVGSPRVEMKTLRAGDRLGRWVIDHCIGPAIPRLYRARRSDDEHVTALVTTLPRRVDFEERLRREAGMLRQLAHDAVPDLIDFGVSREHDVVWMTTSDVDGETLEDRLLMGALPWQEACALVHQIAMGLRHAHEHSIVHRDVRPAKILLTRDGGARIVGFDAAMNEGELSQAAEVPMGPLGYLAPEVITKGRKAGPRADLYALGVVLYEALTGRPAFPAALMDERTDPAERMLEWKTRSKPLRPSGEAPAWLKNLVEKATHPDPAERLPDMDAFVGWLDAARGFWEPEPKPEPPPIADTPPPIMMAAPTLAPPGTFPDPSPPAPPPQLMPLAYVTAASLGVAVGLLFSVVVILMVELPNMG